MFYSALAATGILGTETLTLVETAINNLVADGKTIIGYTIVGGLALVTLVAGGRFALKQVKGSISSAS